MAPTRFRRARGADIALYRSWFADPELARRLSPPTPQWLAHAERPGQALWVAADDAGRMLALFETERDGDVLWFDCAIDPALRGTGRMGAILAAFIAGPAAGCPRLAAGVEPSNRASLSLLRRAGFSPAAAADEDGILRFERTGSAAGS